MYTFIYIILTSTYYHIKVNLDNDKDPDALFGKKYPDWLNIFISKYETVLANKKKIVENNIFNDNKERPGISSTETSSSSSSTTTPTSRVTGMTVGKLSALISCCIMGTISCSNEEFIALDQVRRKIYQ